MLRGESMQKSHSSLQKKFCSAQPAVCAAEAQRKADNTNPSINLKMSPLFSLIMNTLLIMGGMFC